MKSQNIILSILVVMAVFLAIASYVHTEQVEQTVKGVQPSPLIQNATTSATSTMPAAVVRPSETFPKIISLSLLNPATLADGTTITLTDFNDSRCPSDPNINCFWAGNVIAKIHMQKGGAGKDFELTFPGTNGANVFTYNEYKIFFDNVKPESRFRLNPIDKKEYKLGFTISK